MKLHDLIEIEYSEMKDELLTYVRNNEHLSVQEKEELNDFFLWSFHISMQRIKNYTDNQEVNIKKQRSFE